MKQGWGPTNATRIRWLSELAGRATDQPLSRPLTRLQDIDGKESVALSEPQPSGLQIREDAPSYTFYHHSRGKHPAAASSSPHRPMANS